jgi:hypothetical protein
MEARTVDAHAFYRLVLERLDAARVPFLVGGAYALEHYTGIERRTKDLDVFVRPAVRDAALRDLVAGGCVTEVTSPVWIAKARCGEDVVDIIFSSGNGVAVVDDDWFVHAREATILDMRAKLCPPEEMIWSKGYIMERERFDGADVAHLLRACGRTLDWPRLLARFDTHWPVLLVHLLLFAFVYPSERDAVPAWVMDELLAREARDREAGPSRERVCRGTLLSRYQYRIDLERWGYRDGRLPPNGRLTRRQAQALDREPHEE